MTKAKQKHTEGPWKHDPTWGLIMHGKEEIAALHSGNVANARLIAAAPDLLAALEGVLAMLELLNTPGTNDPIESRVYSARAAIKLAKGD